MSHDTGRTRSARAEGRFSLGERLSPRTSFLLRRLGRLAASVCVVVLASFFLIHLVPGDPVRAALGPSASPELVAATQASLGLDKPILQQFVDYLGGLLTGDLGTSIQSHRPVAQTIAERFPATLLLAVAAFAVAIAGALPIGLGMAISSRGGRRRGLDAALSSLLGVLIAIPGFLLAVGFIALFSVQLGLLPAAGWGTIRSGILPVLALALGPMAYLARIVQVEMITVLGTTYMTTARAKRLPSRLVYFRHALPNIVTATLTVGGLILSGLTAATVLVETVFAIPGLGTTMVAAVSTKDYPMVQGVVLVYALIVLGVNLVVDLILITIDPRSSITEG
ncbi:ABC transporter permease [Salinibacterium sp. SYSU T00001]|uniref:ABC transporter permease n=1 Tax=Homoserinimonas sedimenticola TaxID=2986805 RepID=UPI002236BAF9|nr:ABC transporter permease [Salinibacterium sedimenticola]MCW4385356.1 ABC transporter permease [Salinibacterium sedimenticola]